MYNRLLEIVEICKRLREFEELNLKANLSPLSCKKARPATHGKTWKERQLAGERVGEEPNHTTPKKVGPSINHSILSATGCQRDGASSRSSQYSGAQRRRIQAQVGAQAALVPVSQNVVFAFGC
jgi:hypothetical protein